MTGSGGLDLRADPDWLRRALEGVVEEMVSLRRDIHAHPELSWNEVRTSAQVADALVRAGLAPVALSGGTGLVCDIVGRSDGPIVALRADLDALAIEDEKVVAYRSTTRGVAHVCGHDVHTATVLGAGIGLSRMASAGQLPGRVRLVFQPAEEVLPGGALAVLAEGGMGGVQRVFALHCDPQVEAGSVAVRAGPITAAVDSVTVRLSGPGGHTARPHLTVDLVSALADVLVSTPALLSRRVDARAGLSLVWGKVAAGSAENVIPERGEASGTVRVLDTDVWESAHEVIPQLIREVAAPYRAHVEINYQRGAPPAVNDPRATEVLRSAATALFGPANVFEAGQSMGAEDFAWILERVPGSMARLGVRRPGTLALDLHRGDFDIDESAIGCGIRLLVSTVIAALRDLESHGQELASSAQTVMEVSAGPP